MQSLYLARALVRSLHTVTVVCYFQFDKAVVREFEQSGCNVVLMNMKRELGAARITDLLRNYFADSRPDVVHIQYMAPGLLPVLAARLAGIKRVISTVHQPYTTGHGFHAKILLRTAALLCDYFIAVSRAAERSWFGSSYDFRTETKIHLRKHFTIYNCVDVKKIIDICQMPNDFSINIKNNQSDSFVFGYVGRLSYEKGIDVLFAAFDQIQQRQVNNDFFLVIVGEGNEKKLLELRYEKKKWWENVLFVGKQSWEDTMRYFAVMDAVIVPSRFEGFGLSAIEAMAASKPVIAAGTGGLNDIINHNVNGILFEKENVRELVNAMLLIANNSVIRDSVSTNAKRRACDFDVCDFYGDICALYNNVNMK